ncbi:MAG: hypothetical protein JNM07_00050 [Phycisphaerae bacterium]|nr:hypothetical protein [Phycisphaerae bacterium]
MTIACAGCARHGGVFELTSGTTGAVFSTSLPGAAYSTPDASTADLYLTDLPLNRLQNPNDSLADVSGSLVHVHLFLVPKAGSTPIDATACNATVRQLVFAQGVLGLYAGGGFFNPSGDPGDPELAGSMRGASLRLARSSPGFADRLGPVTLAGTFGAPRSEGLARNLAARMEALIGALPDRRAATP